MATYHPQYDGTDGSWPNKGTVPEGLVGTGGLTSSGVRVTGSGTKFLSEVKRNQFLYGVTTQALGWVKDILSDTVILLHRTPETNFAGNEEFYVVQREYSKVTISNVGGANATVNGRTFANGDPDIVLDAVDDGLQKKLEPITYDKLTSELTFVVIH